MRRPAPKVERVWTVLDLVQWGAEYFERKGVDSPRLTIELMLCEVLQVRRLQLYTDHERPLTSNELTSLRAFVHRRAEREPLQYILGMADFYGLTFQVNPSVLIPRPETEILVERAIRHIKEVGGSVVRCLDIGTGSGCIAVSAAVHTPLSLWECIDVSADALAVAHQNAADHSVGERLSYIQMDILEDIPKGPFDLVTMNPPYIPLIEIRELEPEVRDHEPLNALTDDLDGLTFYRRFAEIVEQLVSDKGIALIEIGHGQSTDIREVFSAKGLHSSIIDDLSGVPRVLRIVVGGVTKW